MDRDLAERLVADLERHPPLSPEVLRIDRGMLINLLTATDVPASKRFYEEVKPNMVEIPNVASDQYHFLSIRRILRNDLARNYRLTGAKKVYEAAVAALGIHDSDVWTRKLRMDSELVQMMTQAMVQNGQLYSLLAKFETFDDLSKKIATRPIISIPDATDSEKIMAWEAKNTTYCKESTLGTKRISKTKYFMP